MLLDTQCYNTMQHGYRPGTLRNYRSRITGYYRFCQFYQLQPLPMTEWNLIRYARYLANGVTSYNTVTGYLSAIKRIHEIASIPFPSTRHQLKLELMAIRHELAGPVKQATPITPNILAEIYQVVNQSDDFQTVCFAALILGFCLFLRKSNLVPELVKDFNPKEQLTRQDVWSYFQYTMVDIKWSKTLQYRERELSLPLKPARNNVVCAVHWINMLRTRFSGKPNDPLIAIPKNG